jgi:hypothetical protein
VTLPDPYAQLRTMVEGLRLAAAPADEQIATLPRQTPRELARIHEDVYLLAPSLRDAGLLDGEAMARLAAFDLHHEEMTDDDALWTTEALSSDERWEESRGLASAALAAISG